MSLNGFAPDGNYAALAAGAGSVGANTPNVALPGSGATVLVTNNGPGDVVLAISNAAIQIASADLAHGVLLPAKTSLPLTRGTNTTLGAVVLPGQQGAALNLASGT